jgi:hypothetical protein
MMMLHARKWAFLPALSLIGALGGASVAMAQSSMSSSAMSEANGATTGLGTHHRFATVAAASDHCPGDTIVWSSGSMNYHLSGSKHYGTSKSGFYACKAEADSAGFHAAAD